MRRLVFLIFTLPLPTLSSIPPTRCYEFFVEEKTKAMTLVVNNRFLLRPMRSCDLAAMKLAAQDPAVAELSGEIHTDEALRRYIGRIPSKRALEQRQTWVDLFWGIEDVNPPRQLIGFIYLSGELRDGWAYTGYLLNPSRWGEGIASTVMQALISFGFHELNLQLIKASALETNLRSARVLEKNGFKKISRRQFYGQTPATLGLLEYHYELDLD